MKHIFITYGNEGFAATKERIVREAISTGEFDEVYAYGPENLSKELLESDVFKIHRGGGLWSWKPEIILSTLCSHEEGDMVVYCDAGCSLYPSSEWRRYWKHLSTCDIIAQRLIQRSDRWTRKELIAYFSDMGDRWLKDYQYLSGAIFFKNTPFSRSFVREWRDIMINHPEYAADVPEEERYKQHPTFIESRHDQSVFSCLIYKYLSDPSTRNKLYTLWEHIEDNDIFRKQAIRATRLRNGEPEPSKMKILGVRRRLEKDLVLKPFYYDYLHWRLRQSFPSLFLS